MSEPQEAKPQPVDQENVSEKIITELTRANGILKANISTLYRTARAEIARKNDRIEELQSELDRMLFKRMNYHASQALAKPGPSRMASKSAGKSGAGRRGSSSDADRSANETL